MGVEAEHARKLSTTSAMAHSYTQIEKLHKSKKKSGLPL